MTLGGAVPVGVADDVPVVEPVALGSVGVAGEVPSVPDVEPGVVVTGGLAGADGSTMLGGVPGPYRVLSWSGSRVWVSGGASGKDLTLDREWRWPALVDEALEASGLAAEVLEAVPPPAVVAGADDAWLIPGPEADAGAAPPAVGCAACDGVRAAA